MRVRLIVVLMGLAFCLPSVSAMAQSSDDRRELLDCPAKQIPDAYRTYKYWNKEHVGIRPVVPEIYSRDPEVAKARVRKHLQPSADPKIRKGYFRLMTLISEEGFTSGDTLKESVANMPPEDFLKDLENTPLHYKILPCGRTTLKDLSEAEPDSEVNGLTVPHVNVIRGPWLVNWCEKGVVVPDGPYAGECGFTVVETDPMLIKGGTNAGSTLVTRFTLVCGNPDMWLQELTEELTVKPPVTPPVEQPLLGSKFNYHLTPPTLGPSKIVGSETRDVNAKKHKPCMGPKSRWVCVGAAAAVAGFVFRPGSIEAPVTAGNNTPVKK